MTNNNTKEMKDSILICRVTGKSGFSWFNRPAKCRKRYPMWFELELMDHTGVLEAYSVFLFAHLQAKFNVWSSKASAP